jgi:hypothetical protein
MPIREINLDLNDVVQPFVPSCGGFAPNKDKYSVDDIKDLTPCTLILCIKGRTSMTIEFVESIGMYRCILHGQPIPT